MRGVPPNSRRTGLGLVGAGVVVVLLVTFSVAGVRADARSSAVSARVPSTGGPGRCPDARRGLVWYAERIRHWSSVLGLELERFDRPGKCRYIRREARWRRTVSRGLRQRYELLEGTAELAIRVVFGSYSGQALAVASCESGLRTTASNGQYLGLFQMGNYARQLYGHGTGALVQARAAYRYFVESGRDWSPWSCKP